jgi:hypothetical protein
MAALFQLTALATFLRNSGDKLSQGADPKFTWLPALLGHLFSKCRWDPQDKAAHKTMVVLCKTAQSKFKKLD